MARDGSAGPTQCRVNTRRGAASPRSIAAKASAHSPTAAVWWRGRFYRRAGTVLTGVLFGPQSGHRSWSSLRHFLIRDTQLTRIYLFLIQARTLARQYKELSPQEMKKWEKKAEQDKVRYQDEIKSYVPAPEFAEQGGKKKAKKDPNAPKRNMSAYFLYSIETRPTVKSENPEASFGDIARMISANFKALTEDERKIWDDKAVADKERYERDMNHYRG
jgi:HMG (high mobility group) box